MVEFNSQQVFLTEFLNPLNILDFAILVDFESLNIVFFNVIIVHLITVFDELLFAILFQCK
jgi:hypothetical protein